MAPSSDSLANFDPWASAASNKASSNGAAPPLSRPDRPPPDITADSSSSSHSQSLAAAAALEAAAQDTDPWSGKTMSADDPWSSFSRGIHVEVNGGDCRTSAENPWGNFQSGKSAPSESWHANMDSLSPAEEASTRSMSRNGSPTFEVRRNFLPGPPQRPMASTNPSRQEVAELSGREQLLRLAGISVLISLLLRAIRSRMQPRPLPFAAELASLGTSNLSAFGLPPATLGALGAAFGAVVSRFIPKLLSTLLSSVNFARAACASKVLEDSRRTEGAKDLLASQDPWEPSAPMDRAQGPHGNPERSGARQAPPGNAWSTYAGPKENIAPAQIGGPVQTAGRRPPPKFLSFFEGTREEYMKEHIVNRLREPCERINLNDTALFHLGQKHFSEQCDYFKRLESGEAAIADGAESVFRPVAGQTRAAVGGAPGSTHTQSRPAVHDRANEAIRPMPKVGVDASQVKNSSWFVDDDYDDPPFWWRNRQDLFFELPVTSEEDLTSLANPVYQWWDPSFIAEAENFVAISKPAGMFVVTDDRGLWEVSTTNFIHVTHQRFPDIGSSNEPNQRGICHRLDSHTSGVQIFGKSWEAFRHFTKENSSHRMQKEYLALVDGRLGTEDIPGEGMIDIPMHKWRDYDRREFGSVVCAHEGLPAVTKYKALRQWFVPAKGNLAWVGRDRWFTLVQLRILSGRTHQIRVHMAFIGHPLIGDIKYSSAKFIDDSAFVPRIFLHCMKMEFKEFDGSLFVASSELAPDLQAALKHIEALSEEAEGQAVSSTAGTLPGLGRILEDSKEEHSVPIPDVSEGAAERYNERCRRTMVYRCLNCKSCEEACCTKIQLRNQVGMSWKLTKGSPTGDGEKDLRDAPNAQQQKDAGASILWGAGMLWVPTALQIFQQSNPAASPDQEADLTDEAASSEELGKEWGALGTEWLWAHDGTKQNGWFRLCSKGMLASKWGPGEWQVLRPAEGKAPLLLVTYGGVEHALRLMEGDEARFDVVSMRQTKDGQQSLTEDPVSLLRVSEPAAPVICETQGWPGQEAS